MMKFNEKYHSEHFLHFTKDFLPEDFVEREEDILIKKDRYKEITKAKVLGFCESLDLHVLEMDHNRENDPRIAIATDAFKILADHWIHRALVIFKNESDNYRLSYLTISLDLNEKNKAVRKYSNARRYSFYLGTSAKVRTPEQQLIKNGRVKDIDDLLQRFSVEVVNKQFYLEVAKYFDELVSTEDHNLILPGVSQADQNVRKSFAVRLIGRVMFCWFLKQKKSSSGQLIPDELLSSGVVADNYYHAIVEPLFFAALNTSIDSRDIRSVLFDKVPYLNGGLFNPQSDDYYELDRGTFASKYINTLKISDSWFKGFFELLETYNFTIDENTVFDQELSVDPEMLGRIFENLLAEINPETGSSERKRTGSFYTPRQIVEYMVDQSLIEYLKTKTSIDSEKISALVSYDLDDDASYPLTDDQKQDVVDAIEALRLLDPACGSGAYPIGALQKIVYVLQSVDPGCKLWLNKKLKGVPELYKQKIINEVQSNPFDYTRKLDVIKNSIFGVDIQPVAVDVSRLRCFLTLVVESEINDDKPNRGIEPLPNLDFKFVCANALIGLPKTEKISLFDDHSGIAELSEIMSDYFSCNSHRKNEMRLKFTNAQKSILNKALSSFGSNIGELTQKLTLWDPFSNHSNSWFDPVWMYGIEDKFDIVMGNPPYVKEDINKTAFEGLKTLECYQGKMDLWYLFGACGLDLLAQDGILCFIAINNWTTNDGASKFRKKIIKEGEIISYIDFGDFKVFSAGVQTMVFVIKKSSEKEKFTIAYKKLLDPKISYELIPTFLKMSDSVSGLAEAFNFELVREDYKESYINFVSSGIDEVLKKLRRVGRFNLLDEEVFSGIDVMQDFVAKSHLPKLEHPVSVGDGVFVIDNEEKDLLRLNEDEMSIVRPYYTTKEIGRYFSNKTNLYWIIYAGSELNKKISNYPNIKSHLDKFQDIITSVNKPYGLHRTREESIFTGEKILSIRKCSQPSFSYVDFPCYVSRAFLVIKTNRVNIKYLNSLLNSKIVSFWLRHKGKMQGSNYQIDKGPLLEIPVCIASEDKQKMIIELSEKIITTRLVDKLADIKNIESQIDELVYDLYGLNEEEKEIIRKS